MGKEATNAVAASTTVPAKTISTEVSGGFCVRQYFYKKSVYMRHKLNPTLTQIINYILSDSYG